MTLLLEVQQRLVAIRDELKAIHAPAAAERRSLTEDEQTRWDALVTERTALEQIETRELALAADDGRTTDGGAQQRGDQKWDSFGHFLQAVHRAGVDPDFRDERLTTRAITGMGEAIPSDGGYLVSQDFATELITPVHNTGLIASRLRRIPLSGRSNGIKIPKVLETSRADGSRWGGIQAYWQNEAATKTAAEPTFELLELNLNKLTGLAYATDELLEDASALEAVIREGFREEFTFKLEDAVINGSGSGQPLGLLTSGAKVEVAVESGQTIANTAGHMGLNLTKMWSRLLPRLKPGAVWILNSDILPKVYTARTDSSAGAAPVFLPAGGISGNQFNTILGRPVLEVEYCAAEGTVGDIILTNLSDYLMIERGPMQSASSIHVRFVNDETAFRFVWRVDGQPVLDSAITAFAGNSKTSVVTLAARS